MKFNLQKTCIMCGHKYNYFRKDCPKCNFRKPQSLRRSAFYFLFFSIFTFTVAIYAPVEQTVKNNLDFARNDGEVLNIAETNAQYKEIKLRPMSELSGLSKNEIFDKRKNYVKESTVFSYLTDYEPNFEVYQIEDNLPWIGAEEIATNGIKSKNIGSGASRHSISINNPDLLMSFIVPQFSSKESKYSESDLFLPEKLSYNEEENIIQAEFNTSAFFRNNPDYPAIEMFIDETNARDFGYNWIYCNKKKNITFKDFKNNISLRPYKMQGYYHKGNACGLDSGCNNYSPIQDPMIFVITNNSAYIEFKLWKEKPRNIRQNPDITYIMILK